MKRGSTTSRLVSVRHGLITAMFAICLSGSAPACVQDVLPLLPPNPVRFLFPNWELHEVVDFGIVICNDPVCPGNALLKTLEEPPKHVKFIFCTTDPEKIPPCRCRTSSRSRAW